MRVTDKMAFNQVTNNLQKNRADMNDLQNQAATQKRINKPSDDPVAAARVVGARADEKMVGQFLKNIDVAKSFLETTDLSLSEITESLMRAKEIAIQASNDPAGGPETRRIASLEIEQIRNQAIQVGNKKLGERYIFGGYKTNRPPFTHDGEFQGDDGEMKIQINKDAYIGMNLAGDGVFLGKNIRDGGGFSPAPEIPRTTEELGQYKLNEQQRLGNQQQMDQEQAPVEVRGPASLSREQRIMHAGEPGSDYKTTGINVLSALKEFTIGLRVNDKDTIQEAIDNVDQAISQLVHARAEVGARIITLNAASESLRKTAVDAKQTVSQLEDADLFHTVSEMQKSDSTLKATLETSGKIIQPSLLDFLK